MKKALLLWLLAVPLLQAQPSHAGFDALLKQYVSAEGLVDYRGLKADAPRLHTYLKKLAARPPQATWPAAERLAYWLNAYNAFTLQLVLEHYPIKSIKDITTGPNIPLVHTPWTRKFIQLGNHTYSCLLYTSPSPRD